MNPVFAAAVLALAGAAHAAPPALRVCADPDNLPFSNRRGEGFENRLADLIGRELDRPIEYAWSIPRRGTDAPAQDCDVVMGVPAGIGGGLDTTAPYYRAWYVFVSRAERGLKLESFDDQRLRALKIGIQQAGGASSKTPPAHALSRRGIVANVSAFKTDRDDEPAAGVVSAVENGTVDVAVLWGPLAGWRARRARRPLALSPVREGAVDVSPFAFDISVGVRAGEPELKAELEAALARRAAEVRALLDDYGVPRA